MYSLFINSLILILNKYESVILAIKKWIFYSYKHAKYFNKYIYLYIHTQNKNTAHIIENHVIFYCACALVNGLHLHIRNGAVLWGTLTSHTSVFWKIIKKTLISSKILSFNKVNIYKQLQNKTNCIVVIRLSTNV